jgi:hypothetical protein
MEVLSYIGSFASSQPELILSSTITVVVSLIGWALKPKTRIIYGSTSFTFHDFALGSEGGRAQISVEKFFVQNVGKKPASEVELVFSHRPSSYSIFPPRNHDAADIQGGKFSIKVPSIANKELLIVDVIDVNRIKVDFMSVNCPDDIPKEVEFFSIRRFGRSVYALVYFLMALGFFATVYILVLLIGSLI